MNGFQYLPPQRMNNRTARSRVAGRHNARKSHTTTDNTNRAAARGLCVVVAAAIAAAYDDDPDDIGPFAIVTGNYCFVPHLPCRHKWYTPTWPQNEKSIHQMIRLKPRHFALERLVTT
jgi:hypothetical protein